MQRPGNRFEPFFLDGPVARDALTVCALHVALERFPDDRDAYEMSYYNGELLWTLGRWKDAAEVYSRVVVMDPNGKYLRDAAHAAVLAWKNALAVGDDEERDRAARESDDARPAVPGQIAIDRFKGVEISVQYQHLEIDLAIHAPPPPNYLEIDFTINVAPGRCFPVIGNSLLDGPIGERHQEVFRQGAHEWLIQTTQFGQLFFGDRCRLTKDFP